MLDVGTVLPNSIFFRVMDFFFNVILTGSHWDAELLALYKEVQELS